MDQQRAMRKSYKAGEKRPPLTRNKRTRNSELRMEQETNQPQTTPNLLLTKDKHAQKRQKPSSR